MMKFLHASARSKLTAAILATFVATAAFGAAPSGAVAGFNPQPDPPGRHGGTVGFNPQPEPPGRHGGGTLSFNPQPDPPGRHG